MHGTAKQRGSAAMIPATTAVKEVPRPLETYPSGADQSLAAQLAARVQIEPFNALATGVFFLAILHTFAAARFAGARPPRAAPARRTAQAQARPPSPSLRAEALHFLGEVEVVFGLWAVVLLAAIAVYAGWERRDALRQRHRQLHRAAVRRRDHGARVDAAGRRASRNRRCGGSPAPAAARRRRGGRRS